MLKYFPLSLSIKLISVRISTHTVYTGMNDTENHAALGVFLF